MQSEYGPKHDFLCDTLTCHRKPEIRMKATIFGSVAQRMVCKHCVTLIVEDMSLEDDQLCIQALEKLPKDA